MVNFFANTFVTVIQFIFRVFKKAVCCLRRRRRLSCEPVPLTNIGVVPNVEKDADLQTWNRWDEPTDKSPTSIVTTGKPVDPVQQQIEMYRQQRMAQSQSEDNEEQRIDYFQDMTPKIVRPTKVFLQPRENVEYINSSNFSLAPDPVFNTSELGIWEDTQSWEDQTEQGWDANDMIREKKKVDREERMVKQQKKKMERKSKFPVGWTAEQSKVNFSSAPAGREKDFAPD